VDFLSNGFFTRKHQHQGNNSTVFYLGRLDLKTYQGANLSLWQRKQSDEGFTRKFDENRLDKYFTRFVEVSLIWAWTCKKLDVNLGLEEYRELWQKR